METCPPSTPWGAGLPVALQVVGRRHADAVTIAVAGTLGAMADLFGQIRWWLSIRRC